MRKIISVFILALSTGPVVSDEGSKPIRANSIQECRDTGCTELAIYPYDVDNLDGIEDLSGLTEFRINSTQITDLTPVGGFGNLKLLDISYTGVALLQKSVCERSFPFPR